VEIGLLGILLFVIASRLLILHLRVRRCLRLDGLEGWTDRTDA